MKDAGELLRGIAALLWPLLMLVTLFVFRAQLGSLIDRVRRVKGPGGTEVELDKKLDELEDKLPELEALPPATIEERNKLSPETQALFDLVGGSDGEVLQVASRSPRAGLMLLSSGLEAEMRKALAAVGHDPGRTASIRAMGENLRRVASLPLVWLDAVAEFSPLRNSIVHGGSSASESEILRAIDIGLSLLDVVRSLPYERHVVTQASLPVFADEDGRVQRENVSAVLLAAKDVNGELLRSQAFPTTRSHFQPGQEVAWDWDTTRHWDESWYHDRESGNIEYGWTSSAEFIGRVLDEL